MTLSYCGIDVEHREVLLKDKPAAMLEVSPKGTVPVLVHQNGSVLEESMDIIDWALARHDPAGWRAYDQATLEEMAGLVQNTETHFKPSLDRYKYHYKGSDAAGDEERNSHRTQCMEFLAEVNIRLQGTAYLFGDSISYADVALFPFVRQFANVETDWFESAAPAELKHWLSTFLTSALFLGVMQKHKLWQADAS